MSIREFIAALPKAELNLQLTGAFRRESLMMIARQNGVPAESDDFAAQVAQLDAPEPGRVDEIARAAGRWVMYPEDIALAVYDIGVALSKQNVPYAEVAVTPHDFVGSAKMNFETFLDALNDGRDRALRAWAVDLAWALSVDWDYPRGGDDVARWATGSAAREGNVVAISLAGREEAQPIGQFRRAFATARRKSLNTIANAGSRLGAPGIAAGLDVLQPNRLTDPRGLLADEESLERVVEAEIPALVSLSRAVALGAVKQPADYPLKELLANGVQVVLSSPLPSLLQTSLIDEYVLAHEACGLDVEELVALARRSIALAFLDEERKESLLRRFDFDAKAAQTKL